MDEGNVTTEDNRVALQPVESIEVTILDDNTVDALLAGNETVNRAPLVWDFFERPQLRAEHGYALFVTLRQGTTTTSLLYDAGIGRDTVVHNMDILGVRTADLRTIVLSHGHVDHHGGLEGIIRRVGRSGLPLLVHPDAWKDRKVIFPTGTEVHLPPPSQSDLDKEGVLVVEERAPSLLLDGVALVTGQVLRRTDFETGFGSHYAKTATGWESDPMVWDDQALVLNLKGKGLIVCSSCSHAGVINVLRYAQDLTGIEQVHAFVGGMHLSGGAFEPRIPQTLEALTAIAPTFIVPGHCTGWKMTHEIARRMPTAYVQTSVGTRLRFL